MPKTRRFSLLLRPLKRGGFLWHAYLRPGKAGTKDNIVFAAVAKGEEFGVAGGNTTFAKGTVFAGLLKLGLESP
jgi:hypothetical protein